MLSFLKPTVYIQISAERVTVKNVKSGASLSEVPEIAFTTGGKTTVLGIGNQARQAAVAQSAHAQVLNPFAHPRTLVSDFTTAQALLKAMVRQVLGQSLLALSPSVVIHPLGSPAGGFTEVENRAFREMALGAGASQAWVWNGRPLTDQEVLSQSFPLAEGRLAG
ncbi:rod shape-determining protein [Hydrogenophaga sp. ANAO-22]|uniref:rod shape-determining protein n=1 Tax=Hydrogenophaga sp. ANAO-22 TaxID=3166645 RepID=UPI0036D40C24